MLQTFILKNDFKNRSIQICGFWNDGLFTEK